MKVTLPLLVKDLSTARWKNVSPVEEITIDTEDYFLDGPIGPRVAVLDFDEQGALRAPARFRRSDTAGGAGRYDVNTEVTPGAVDPSFHQTSVFATVFKALKLYEEPDTLGRRIRWAFDGPQLFVVPRAGEWQNAFYERESHSLQFFSFPSVRDGAMVHTSLSQDVVAHETGHAILDGIAPDLYNAVTPQSLALHEALADITALLCSLRSRELARRTLQMTRGDLTQRTVLNLFAEEFGEGVDPMKDFLRDLLNDRTLSSGAGAQSASRSEPHALSEVLSGALYRFFVAHYEELRADGPDEFATWEKALFLARERFKRMALRALDYLPPGEVSFADYGRAILAADAASHGAHRANESLRNRLRDAFVAKGMATREALEIEPVDDQGVLDGVDLTTLLESDWAAYDFANTHRAFLRIPEKVPLRVRPRLDVSKLYYHTGDRDEVVRELVFKVSWDHVEENPGDLGLPRRRQITVGTTVAIDWAKRKVRARLTTEQGDQLRADRDSFLRRLCDEGSLELVSGSAAKRTARDAAVFAETTGDLLRLRGTARRLDLARGEAPHG